MEQFVYLDILIWNTLTIFVTLELTHVSKASAQNITCHVKLNQAQIIVCQCHGADKIFLPMPKTVT